MSNDKQETSVSPTATLTPDALAGFAKMLADAIAGAMPKQRAKITIGEYQATRGNHYHPDKAKEVKTTRVCYNNGAVIQHETTYDAENALLNRITHSGRYLDRLVEVTVRQEGGGVEEVHITYNNKREGIDQWRNILQTQPSTRKSRTVFEALLAHIVEEQELEDLEQQELQEARASARVRARGRAGASA